MSMQVQNSIDTLVSNIHGKQWDGSSIKDGKLYHNLPFLGFDTIKSHRTETQLRWDRISKYIPAGKTILDLGCNVGAFSILASLAGASKVVGIDYDEQSLQIAKYVVNRMELKNIEFRCEEINSKLIEELGVFDVTLWLSQWMWLVKKLGMDEAKRLLYKMSKKSGFMIFESAANDGMAGIKAMTQKEIENIFRSNTCYSMVKNIGNTKEWYDRDILVGRKGITRWKGYTARIKRLDNNTIRKVFKPEYTWMVKREEEVLKRLNGYNNFPKLISVENEYIDMTYCGNNKKLLSREQCMKILSALKEMKIVHRDITPKNLLVKEEMVYLIDFGWCLFDGETESPVKPPECLGLHYYKNGIWDDGKAMEMVLLEMGL